MFDGLFAALHRLSGRSPANPVAGAMPRPAQAKANKPLILPKSKHWHAVTIEPCRKACAAALKAEGARYLANEAPRLPLAGCDTADCTCHYRHYDDRRADDPIGIEPKDLLSQPMRRDTD